MKLTLTPLAKEDSAEVLDIFNHYSENTFAAYSERKVSPEFFDMLLFMTRGYPTVTARNEENILVGFGCLRPYNPMPVFLKTAEILYFLKPGCTGIGIGKIILDNILERAKKMGIHTIMANVSSLNRESISFHLKNGFSQCGHFREIGQKKDQLFDVIYFQKIL
ncbi:MAG: GNAT family N-acetyltransferase [Syntrophorhabdaceae bacterium]